MTAALTDAQIAAALQLDFRQWKAARRAGFIPEPAIRIPHERWSEGQLRALLGEPPSPGDVAAEEAKLLAELEHAESLALQAVEKAAREKPARRTGRRSSA